MEQKSWRDRLHPKYALPHQPRNVQYFVTHLLISPLYTLTLGCGYTPSQAFPSMATVKYSPDLQSKIRKTLRRLSKDLLRSGIALQDSDLHEEYLNAHAIERLTDLPWTQEEDSKCSSSFATPLASGLMDTLYEDAFREEKQKWPRHDFVLNGRFYTAHHLASTLLGYSSSIYWEFTTSPWDTME